MWVVLCGPSPKPVNRANPQPLNLMRRGNLALRVVGRSQRRKHIHVLCTWALGSQSGFLHRQLAPEFLRSSCRDRVHGSETFSKLPCSGPGSVLTFEMQIDATGRGSRRREHDIMSSAVKELNAKLQSDLLPSSEMAEAEKPPSLPARGRHRTSEASKSQLGGRPRCVARRRRNLRQHLQSLSSSDPHQGTSSAWEDVDPRAA